MPHLSYVIRIKVKYFQVDCQLLLRDSFTDSPMGNGLREKLRWYAKLIRLSRLSLNPCASCTWLRDLSLLAPFSGHCASHHWAL
jgi:hypothetical protein